MSAIWLDVTTILGWRRPAVGVVRTEAECAAYGLSQIAEAQVPIQFCCFDRALGYLEVDPSLVREALARIALPEKPAAQTARPSFRQRGKVRLLRLINRLPEWSA